MATSSPASPFGSRPRPREGTYDPAPDRDVLCRFVDRDGDIVEVVHSDPRSTPVISVQLSRSGETQSVFIPDDPEPLIAAIRAAAVAHVAHKQAADTQRT